MLEHQRSHCGFLHSSQFVSLMDEWIHCYRQRGSQCFHLQTDQGGVVGVTLLNVPGLNLWGGSPTHSGVEMCFEWIQHVLLYRPLRSSSCRDVYWTSWLRAFLSFLTYFPFHFSRSESSRNLIHLFFHTSRTSSCQDAELLKSLLLSKV